VIDRLNLGKEMLMITRAKTRTVEIESSRLLSRTFRIIMFVIFTAISAQLAVRLPFTPVPVTMQTLFVALAGILLGSRDGFYAVATYVALGISGIPWFANFSGGPHVLFGPTGGYIAAFPFSAWVAGRFVEAFGMRRATVFVGTVMSSILILFSGVVYLAGAFGLPLHLALSAGATPFVAVEIFKAGLLTVMFKSLNKDFKG